MDVYVKSAESATNGFARSKRWGNGKSAKAVSGNGKPPGPRHVTGRYLAHNHLNPRGRAKLAAALIEGRAVVDKLTAKQIMLICRANAPYVAEARKPPVKEPKLAELLATATPQELMHGLGDEKLWELLEYATA